MERLPTVREPGVVKLKPDDEFRPETDVPREAPRPPGSFPRAIAHNERVEYSYDPETDEFHARIIDSTEPVVTRWDNSPPLQEERPVGTFDVTPNESGVQAEHTGRAVVPDGVKDELKEQAEETGERASSTALLKYQHDLDSGQTDLPRTSAQSGGAGRHHPTPQSAARQRQQWAECQVPDSGQAF